MVRIRFIWNLGHRASQLAARYNYSQLQLKRIFHTIILLIHISHKLGSLMHWLTTTLSLTDIPIPNDRIFDGINLLPALLNNITVER